MKHHWSLALATSDGQFHCVLCTIRLEVNFVAALPGFHALTGCDQKGTICGKSEVSCRNTLKQDEQQVLEAFPNLGSSAHVQDDVVMRL